MKNPFRRPSEPDAPPAPEPVLDMTCVLGSLEATARWLDTKRSLPPCSVAIDKGGEVELTWHEASTKTARRVVSALPGHWEVKTAGFIYLRSYVDLPAEVSIVERRIECTIFPADDADVTSLFTVSL